MHKKYIYILHTFSKLSTQVMQVASVCILEHTSDFIIYFKNSNLCTTVKFAGHIQGTVPCIILMSAQLVILHTSK